MILKFVVHVLTIFAQQFLRERQHHVPNIVLSLQRMESRTFAVLFNPNSSGPAAGRIVFKHYEPQRQEGRESRPSKVVSHFHKEKYQFLPERGEFFLGDCERKNSWKNLIMREPSRPIFSVLFRRWFCHEKIFSEINNRSGSSVQIFLYGYGGVGRVEISEAFKDTGGQLWLSLGSLNAGGTLDAKIKLQNTGDLHSYAKVKLTPKGTCYEWILRKTKIRRLKNYDFLFIRVFSGLSRYGVQLARRTDGIVARTEGSPMGHIGISAPERRSRSAKASQRFSCWHIVDNSWRRTNAASNSSVSQGAIQNYPRFVLISQKLSTCFCFFFSTDCIKNWVKAVKWTGKKTRRSETSFILSAKFSLAKFPSIIWASFAILW